MEITHVIRGEEWISSAPKHKLLYEYFGWQMPELTHLPLLRNPDKSKLSKRKNPTSILYYQRMGFMPEAVLNYLGRMGWSMPDEREKFTLDEMLKEFGELYKRYGLGESMSMVYCKFNNDVIASSNITEITDYKVTSSISG